MAMKAIPPAARAAMLTPKLLAAPSKLEEDALGAEEEEVLLEEPVA